MRDYLIIGRVIKAHGVHGAVKVMPASDDPERFSSLAHVFLKLGGEYVKLSVTESSGTLGQPILRLRGYDDRNAAESLVHEHLYIDRANAIELREGSYFICDLIGCQVETDAGELLGKLTDVLQYGAADVYVVKGGSRGELMFPALTRLLLKVDVGAGRILINESVLHEVCEL